VSSALVSPALVSPALAVSAWARPHKGSSTKGQLDHGVGVWLLVGDRRLLFRATAGAPTSGQEGEL